MTSWISTHLIRWLLFVVLLDNLLYNNFLYNHFLLNYFFFFNMALFAILGEAANL